MILSEQQIAENNLEKLQHIFSEVEKERPKHTVLIVDDEENNLQLLKRTLRRKFNV